MLNLKLLDTFVVLSRELHIGRTAKQLKVSTATISQRLSQMEEQLGGELAIRTTHSMELTDLGKALQREATALIDLAQAAEGRLLAQASGSSGRLHLTFIGSVGTFILPGLIRRASEMIPDMTIEIGSQGFTARIEEMLETHHSDIGISRTPVRSRRLTWRPLYNDPLVLVTPQNHPLAASNEIDLRNLRNETHIVFPNNVGSIVAELTSGMYRDAGYAPTRRIEVTETMTAVGLVGSGVGVSIMPQSTQHIGIPGVRYIPLKNQVMTQVIMAWRSNDSNPLRARFVDEMEKDGKFIDVG